MEKMTKRNAFETVIEMATAAGRNDIVEFAQHEIELLDKRAAKAKATKAAKAQEPDAMTETIAAALTDEFQTAADIVVAIGDENITPAKATFRLNALVEAGIAVKEDIKVEGSKSKRKGFKRA